MMRKRKKRPELPRDYKFGTVREPETRPTTKEGSKAVREYGNRAAMLVDLYGHEAAKAILIGGEHAMAEIELDGHTAVTNILNDVRAQRGGLFKERRTRQAVTTASMERTEQLRELRTLRDRQVQSKIGITRREAEGRVTLMVRDKDRMILGFERKYGKKGAVERYELLLTDAKKAAAHYSD